MNNTDQIIAEVLKTIEDPNEVHFINMITGSQADEQKDFQMFSDIINRFRQSGFTGAEFGLYSQHISDPKMMQALSDLGVVTFCVTMEITSDEQRSKLYGRKGKGRRSFNDYMEMLKKAESLFPYVSISLVLGHEDSSEMKANLDRMAGDTGAFINHFIPRIFLPRQHEILHPEALGRGLAYYVELCRHIEDINAGRNTFGNFFDERFNIKKFEARFRS